MRRLTTLILLALVACHDSGNGGGTNPPAKPPIEPAPRVSLTDHRARMRSLAERLQLHPADKSGSHIVKALATGGTASLSQLPCDYWNADIAWRLVREYGAQGGREWFCQWLRLRETDWAKYPSGSQNHQWAQALGPYAALDVLGPDRFSSCSSESPADAIKRMQNLTNGIWTCCGGSGNPSYSGEITGSRHYAVRVWSYQWALADLGKDPEAKLTGQNLDTAVAFMRGKVRADGIWPVDLMPRVRPERDELCQWPDAAIRAKYPELPAHPSHTPYISYALFGYVNYNPDFQGHWAANLCDERSENNNIGYLLGGARWRPLIK